MAVNEQLKRFSKQQLSVLVFSVLNTVLAIACGIWALVIFLKKKEKGDKELTPKIHLVTLSGTALLGQVCGFYGVLKENLFASILFGHLVAFHYGVDLILGFDEKLFWIWSGADIFGLVAILLFIWSLNSRYYSNYQKNLGNGGKRGGAAKA